MTPGSTIFGPTGYEMIRVVCTTSDNYAEVFAVFERSLAPCVADGTVEVLLNTLALEERFESFGFGADSWHHAILEKLRFALGCLEARIAEDEHVVISDADIQFLQPRKLVDLVAQARERDLEYYGMQEAHQKNVFNGGFYIVKNTPAVRAFLGDVIEGVAAKRNKYADQEILNKELASGRLRHAAIDTKRCVWGDGRPTPDAVFHHAVCTVDNAGKLKQFGSVRAKMDKVRV